MDNFNNSYRYKETDLKNEQSNTLLYVLSSLLVCLLLISGYVFYSYDFLKKGELEEKYVAKDELSFYMLPEYEQNEYISLYNHNNKIDTMNSQISQLRNNKSKIKEKIVEVEKLVEVEKIVEVPKVIEKVVEKKVFTNSIDKSKFNTYQCYDMVDGGLFPSKSCIKKLHTFLDNNKKSKLFEVIGVVNKTEFELLNKIKNKVNKNKVKRLEKIAQLGLSRQRVLEGTWSIKNYLGESTNVDIVNYTIHSKDNLAGFVVRAYK